MMRTRTGWHLREATAADSEALASLAAASADGGRVAFAVRHRVPIVEATRLRRPSARGVVAVEPHGSVIGAGWVSFGHGRVGSRPRPVALLNSLAVHPQWRRRGIASAITRWRLSAIEDHDPTTIAVAAIQAGNTISEANARSWATQILGDLVVTPTPVIRRRAPVDSGLWVRPARLSRAEEVDGIVSGLDRFCRDQLLAAPVTAADLRSWVATALHGRPLNSYFVVTDSGGRLLAGLGLEREAALSSMHVVRMPAVTRLASRVLRVVPNDGVLHNLNMRMAWYAPGRHKAAHHLWRSVRWLARDAGTTLVATRARESPLAQMLRTPPWAPRTTLRVVARSPEPLPVTDLLGLSP